MSQRMIFFPHKRKALLMRWSMAAAVMVAMIGIFLVGVQVGVQNAAVLNNTAPLLTAELMAFEK